jgi:plastocyanin
MKSLIRAGVSAVLLAAATACSSAPEAPAEPPVIANPVDPATAGAITGTVMLTGKTPDGTPINMGSDPYCEGQPKLVTSDVVSGAGGTLQNVFIYVKDGLGDRRFPIPSTPVVLDQKGCQYAPRVLGIQAGQTLEIHNSDSTLHNMHASPERNQEFNKALGQQGLNHTHTFSTAEVMVPFKCDVHRWMRAWVGVLDHPFHAVTGADGTFSLTGLPPGTYTIEAWHETLGRQTQSVTIGDSESKPVAFTFST